MEFIHEANRIYCQSEDGHLLAEITFPPVQPGVVLINHTFVDPSLRGQGVADKLVRAAIEAIRAQNLKTDVSCSYAVRWFAAHPEQADVLSK